MTASFIAPCGVEWQRPQTDSYPAPCAGVGTFNSLSPYAEAGRDLLGVQSMYQAQGEHVAFPRWKPGDCGENFGGLGASDHHRVRGNLAVSVGREARDRVPLPVGAPLGIDGNVQRCACQQRTNTLGIEIGVCEQSEHGVMHVVLGVAVVTYDADDHTDRRCAMR